MRRQLTSLAKSDRVAGPAGRVLDRVVPWPDRFCTVVTFHRIETGESQLYPGLASLEPDDFEGFVAEVAERYHPIDVGELVAALDGPHRLPPRSVLFTFDDGYLDFRDVAWPALKAHGVPAVLFVPTAFADHPTRRFWWDHLYTALAASSPSAWRAIGIQAETPLDAFRAVRDRIKTAPHDRAMEMVDEMVGEIAGATDGAGQEPDRDRVLDWDELRKLASDGVTLAPHSRTHPMLDQVDARRLDDEVRGSLDDMADRVGHDAFAPVFAYPSGGHDPAVREAVRAAGYQAAFTTERGVVETDRCDRFRLPRLNIGRGTSAGLMAAEASMRRSARMGRRAARRAGR